MKIRPFSKCKNQSNSQKLGRFSLGSSHHQWKPPRKFSLSGSHWEPDWTPGFSGRVRTAQHCKQPAKVVGKQWQRIIFIGCKKQNECRLFRLGKRQKQREGDVPWPSPLWWIRRVQWQGWGPYWQSEERKVDLGMHVFHYHGMLRSAQSSGCWCHNFRTYFGFSLSLSLSLSSFSFMPLSGRASDCAHIWIIMNRGQKKTWYSFQKDLLPES
jgi:hypothetical protein